MMRALPAYAQESCGAEAEIIALADYVLANRSKLPKLQSRRNGATSAYLKIHYQELGPEQVETIVGPLATARVDGANELLISWRISTAGLEATLSTSPAAEKELLTPGAGISMLRAAVLSGEAPALFDKMAALPERERSMLEMGLVQALVDLDAESAQAIAAEALSRNLLVVGGGLIATHADTAAWQAFIDGLADKSRAEDLIRRLYWLPALRGQPAYPRLPVADAQGQIARALIHKVMTAAARTPEREYLQTYLNMTGDFAGAGAAAAMINDLTRDGATIDLETAWLVVYEALRAASTNPGTVGEQLKAIPVSGLRFPGDDVQAVIDAMLAVEAFKSAARGNGVPPEMVQGVSTDFFVQLPAWREAAEIISRSADLTAFRSSGQRLAIVANLLFAIGRHADLARFLVSTVPNPDSIRLAEAFAEALDRRCGGHLSFPGEALTMPGKPLFRFDPRS
jgi:hypothetical protein